LRSCTALTRRLAVAVTQRLGSRPTHAAPHGHAPGQSGRRRSDGQQRPGLPTLCGETVPSPPLERRGRAWWRGGAAGQ
jgi:hypothetical protein